MCGGRLKFSAARAGARRSAQERAAEVDMSRADQWRTRFLWLTLMVVGANYLAQIPYYLDVYYFPHGAAPSLSGSFLLGLTFVWFLVGYLRLRKGSVKGYWLLLSFLVTEVFFYAHNMFIQVMHGYPPFLHLQARDPILTVVFDIGYLNMLLGAYFIYALLRHRRDLIAPPAATALSAR
jgi:hypothetical protein